MILAWLLLLTGLTISAVAIYYSVVGLTAIFAAAALPIIVMGTTLEVAKLVCASWLKANWGRVPLLMKTYVTVAVAVLMLITSMGIFGFLSKAHIDQSLVSGDVQSKIAVIEEKIKTERDNIEAAKKALAQMDASVDQTMARSTNEAGAIRAAQLRKSQSKERASLQAEISTSQKAIAALNDEAALIRAEIRKVEAEVGPIKYIAKFVYGDNPDANILEKAVTWVIIIIVFVFDPLAVIMLLAAQMTFSWRKLESEAAQVGEKPIDVVVPTVETDSNSLADEHISQIKKQATSSKTTFVDLGEHPKDTYGYEEQTETKVPATEPVTATGGDITAPEEQQAIEQWNRMVAEAEKAVEAELARGEQLLQAEEKVSDVPVLENEEMWTQRVIDEDDSKKKTYMTKDEFGQIMVKNRS